MKAQRLAVAQRSEAWLEARRSLITGTDIPAILGLSPWRSEADVAADKQGTAEPVDEHLRMRLGAALEPFIASEYTRLTGRAVVRAHGMYLHPTLPWAAASLDFRCRSYNVIVECKWTGSRSRFADGLPQDVEAQVRWQLGVTGYARADVAALVAGDELQVLTVTHDEELWRGLVAVAADFRERLAAGGPFAHNTASVARAYPADDGEVLVADDELADAARRLLALRAQVRELEAAEEQLTTALKARMGTAAVLAGSDFRVTWKTGKDRADTDWRAVATDAMAQIDPAAAADLVANHTTYRPVRTFRAVPVTREG